MSGPPPFQSLLVQVSFKTRELPEFAGAPVVSIPSRSGLLQNEERKMFERLFVSIPSRSGLLQNDERLRPCPFHSFQSLLVQVSFKTLSTEQLWSVEGVSIPSRSGLLQNSGDSENASVHSGFQSLLVQVSFKTERGGK